MHYRWSLREHLLLGADLLKWLLLVTPMAIAVGSACALFLWSLERATQLRIDHGWLLFLLPLAGAGIALLYQYVGREVEGGNNLIMDQIHRPGGGVPLRMAPLILVTTVVTHLFGGSAGREGTAVQLGGSLAGGLVKRLRWLSNFEVRVLLMAGIAAGFGGVFGTPLAGAIFALEVLAMGRLTYEAVVPCLIAAIVSDWTCSAWGAHHVQYQVLYEIDPNLIAHLDLLLLGKVALAAVAFGLASVLFAEMTHAVGSTFRQLIPAPVLRPVVGGVVIIALVYLLGTRDYLGLGVHSAAPGGVSILSSFEPGGAHAWSWWWKLLFTAITLGAGFKGGEVTPLFFIGAALGNTLAWLLDAPVDLFAALGFVAVFAGATNTPLACTVMAIELFGPLHTVYYAVACFLAYLLSGHSSIYSAQRIAVPKATRFAYPTDVPLGTLRSPPPAAAETPDAQQPAERD